MRRPDARPDADRHRPAHRRVELRRRASRHGRQRRRHRLPRRRRRRLQGRRLHRRHATDRRPLRGRLRRARDRPPVQRRPHVQRRQRGVRRQRRWPVRRARQRYHGHGLRGHLRHRQPPGPQRPVLLGAQHRSGDELRQLHGVGDRRGPDGLAAGLRRDGLVQAHLQRRGIRRDREPDELHGGRHRHGDQGHRRIPGSGDGHRVRVG